LRGGGWRKQESSFSEEKEAKRLLFACARASYLACVQVNESFLVLFFKKEHSPFALTTYATAAGCIAMPWRAQNAAC
jgi:hypothetical protein